MALVNCPECEHIVSDSAIACPSCGHPMQQPVAGKVSRIFALPILRTNIKKLIHSQYLYRFLVVILGAWLVGCISTSNDPSKIYLIFKYPLGIFGIVASGFGALMTTFVVTGSLIYIYGKIRKSSPSFWSYFLTTCAVSSFFLFAGKV